MLPYYILEDLPHDALLAVECTLYAHQDAYDLLNHIHGRGICVTFRKTAQNLHTLLNQYNKPHHKIARYIDLISKQIGSPYSLPHATYLASHDLNQLFASLQEEIEKLPIGERFVVIDSLSDISHLFSEETLFKFLIHTHNFASKKRSKLIVLYNPEKVSPALRSLIHKKADHVVALS